MRRKLLLGLAFAVIAQVAAAFAQQPAVGASSTVGPEDVLVITPYDQQDLTGTFTVEIDGSFTYPMIARTRAGQQLLLQQVLDGAKCESAVEPRDAVAVPQRLF